MKKIKFFQIRPLGETKGNFALSRNDAEKLLEKYFDIFEIIETSSFGNGVLVTANIDDDINLKYFEIKCRSQIEGEIIKD